MSEVEVLGFDGVAASRVALRVLEVPQLAVALEAMGAPLEALAEARAARPRLALLCTGRPLFFTWMPDGRSIIAVRSVSLTTRTEGGTRPRMLTDCS